MFLACLCTTLQAHCLHFGMLQCWLCPVLTPPCPEHQQVGTW